MVKLHLVCGVLLFAFLGWAHGLPVKEQELEEVLTKLQELKRLNDGNDQVQIFPLFFPPSYCQCRVFQSTKVLSTIVPVCRPFVSCAARDLVKLHVCEASRPFEMIYHIRSLRTTSKIFISASLRWCRKFALTSKTKKATCWHSNKQETPITSTNMVSKQCHFR